MSPHPWRASLVSRLVGWLCVVGLVLSAGLGAMEYRRSMDLLSMATTQQVLQLEQNLQQVLRAMVAQNDPVVIRNTLEAFVQDPQLRAVRLNTGEGDSYAAGKWLSPGQTANVWTLTDGHNDPGDHLDTRRPTVLVASFVAGGRASTIQMLVDGPLMYRRLQHRVISELGVVWTVLSAMLLLGLLLVRRWLIRPLGRILKLIQRKAPSQMFEETAAEVSGEMGELAGSIAQMLRSVESMTDQLRRREREFQSLFQFAPTAMVGVDGEGRVIHVNDRATGLLGAPEAKLVGRTFCEVVVAEDRGVWRQSLEKLRPGVPHRCELRLEVGGRRRDVIADFTAEEDSRARGRVVHFNLLDTTENNRLLRQITEQRKLLDLLINHMSDAILLIGADRRILTVNRQMAELQRARIDELVGQLYDPAEFWNRLDLVQPQLFQQRIAAAAQGPAGALQEQFETRDGGLLFQVVPVCDELRQPIAQLWVVQDISQQVRVRRMLDQQSAQLRALQRVGRKIYTVDTLDELLALVVRELSEVFQTEALGVALRAPSLDHRCVQLIWQGSDRSSVPATSKVAQAVSDQLMRRVLGGKATSFWTDLSQHPDWAVPFGGLGLESMAATPLIDREQTQGVLWIARRGGNRIEREQLYLLETMAPMLAEAFQNAQLRQQLRNMQLTDAVTNLPSARMLPGMIAKLVSRPGHPWSMLLVDLDDFRSIVMRYGHGAGDAVLKLTAQALREACRASDMIVRLEKDQFVLLCPELEAHAAGAIAERVRSRVAAVELETLGVKDVTLGCTIAMACSPHDHTRGELTLEVARQRLAAAKATRALPRR